MLRERRELKAKKDEADAAPAAPRRCLRMRMVLTLGETPPDMRESPAAAVESAEDTQTETESDASEALVSSSPAAGGGGGGGGDTAAIVTNVARRATVLPVRWRACSIASQSDEDADGSGSSCGVSPLCADWLSAAPPL